MALKTSNFSLSIETFRFEDENDFEYDITIEDENELVEREVFPQLTSESFDNDDKLTLKSFFAFCSVVFFFYEDKRRKDGKDF